MLSLHKNLTWDIVIANPDKPWCWYALSKNKNIKWDIIIRHPDKSWDWQNISMNENITWENVEECKDKPWNWEYLSSLKMQKEHEKFIRKECIKLYFKLEILDDLENLFLHPDNISYGPYIDLIEKSWYIKDN